MLPLLLNLLESRELHVRTVILEHMGNFASIVSQDDLHSVVLPEVLVGLSDNRDEVIQYTLHALADLVPLMGSEAIIGGNASTRSIIFTDSRPRVSTVRPLFYPVLLILSFFLFQGKSPQVVKVGKTSKKTPPLAFPLADRGQRNAESRKERMEQMKAKREEQRLKRKAQKKLGEHN